MGNLHQLKDAVIQIRKTSEAIPDRTTEAVTRKCSVKKVFLKIPRNSQENTFAGVSFLI